MATPINLFDHDVQSLTELMLAWGEPHYRAQSIVRWLHQFQVTDFEQMTDLSRSLRAKLREQCEIKIPTIALERRSPDQTIKWLVRLDDGNCIETVYIPEKNRATLCISSQVGCALNCSFCSTGKEGFNRNLTTAEIIGQLRLAHQRLHELNSLPAITNVVMMGMGEPLLNYQPVVRALRLMLSDIAYGLSKYRVTVSTSGVLPAMVQLKQEVPVSLAVSLHAPNDALRNELVPLNRKYPLAELMKVCRNYFPARGKQKIFFEYVCLEGVNDQLEHAEQLIRLIKNVPCKMNLIPFNPFPKTHYRCSSPETIAGFQQRLMQAGINTRVRRTRGDDIEGACGQLAGQIQDRTGRNLRWQKTGKLVPM